MKTIQFTPGLNVVYGKNEAGKSTIHAFVRSMLFGIPDTPEGNSRYERYLPWDNPQEYCGKLWLCREDKVYRIERNFMRGQTGLLLVNETDGITSQAPKQELRKLLCGLTENNYLNTICIEQLKSASEPQLANELQKLVINTSQSKNIRIDVEQAKSSLQSRREYLESHIVKDLDGEQKELEQKKEHTQAGISRLQKLRYVKSSQQRELVQKLEQERLAADENLLSYERERDELRRRYEADQKAWDNAPPVDPQKAQRKPIGWVAMLLLTVFFGAATAFLYLTRGIYSDLGMILVSGSLCLTVICFVGIFAAYSIGNRRLESYRYNCEIVQKLQENLQESLKEFEACKQRAPQTLEDACRPIQEKLDQLDRELEYLRFQTEEEKKLQNTLEQKQKQLTQSRETNETYQEELDAVNIALKTIQKVSVRIHDTFGNLLNSEASRLLYRLTNGRYDRLTIDPEMNVMLYNEDRAIVLSSVSRGTIEQIYLCIRMAAAGLLWQKEPMPFLFDDVFAFYDDERIEEAMKLLKDCGHQAIIFSCHTREDSLI